MNVKAIFLFSLAALFSGFLPLAGQGLEDSLYNRLEKANLVVRLPGQQKKIEALRASLSEGDLSETAKKRLQIQLDNTVAETAEQNETIIQVFQKYFGVMPVYFVYDTTHHPAQAVFLDKDLQATDRQLSGDQILQLRFGRPLADAGNRPESLVLTDSRLHDLQAPFPKPLVLNSIGYGINKLLAPDIAFVNMLERRVKKLDRQLAALKYGPNNRIPSTEHRTP